jgi:hypothetical protein
MDPKKKKLVYFWLRYNKTFFWMLDQTFPINSDVCE